MRDAAEARYCADFLVASDPWLTLGLTFEMAMQRLTDSTREIYVATVGGEIVGVLILFLDGALKGYLQTIAVHPDWRSRGLGARMIAFAEQRIFRVSQNVFLCVSSFNLEAQKFYARLGYQRVGELPDFVVAGFSEILMRKTRGPLRDFKPAA
ncbi:MAG: N-acetyltransferase [Pedosphaera sp.]|nr:N-acetyltransferase [Pedosphaera sp.]